MGFRASTAKPMIHLRQKNEKIPFDISTIRTFEYDLTDLDAVDEIKGRLKKTILTFNFSDNNDESNVDKTENCLDHNEAPQMLSVLYDIQDQITTLRDEIRNKDSETKVKTKSSFGRIWRPCRIARIRRCVQI